MIFKDHSSGVIEMGHTVLEDEGAKTICEIMETFTIRDYSLNVPYRGTYNIHLSATYIHLDEKISKCIRELVKHLRAYTLKYSSCR